MKAQSAKAKGRRLQKAVQLKILDTFWGLDISDVQSRSSGAGGEDIMLSMAARERFPVSIECKNRETNKMIWDWFNQAVANAGDYTPIVVVGRNGEKKQLAILNFDDVLRVFRLLEAEHDLVKSQIKGD